MKRFVLILITLVLACVSVGCGEIVMELAKEVTPSEDVELTETATYQDFNLTLGEGEQITGNDGEKILKVHAVFTNNGQDPYYAYSCFAVRAFQNDIALDEYYSVTDEKDNKDTEIRNGKSIEVLYYFALTDDSEVEVLIGEPTAAMKSIGRKDYPLNKQ